MSRVNIIISQNSGLKWWKDGTVYVKGYAWIGSKYYNASSLASYLSQKNRKTFLEIVKILNGSYAIIMDTPNYTIAVVDRIRSIPLFYSVDCSMITDNPLNIYPRYKVNIDKTAFAELLTSGMYANNNRTLFEDIRQIPACNIYTIENNSPQGAILEQYYVHRHNVINRSKEDLYRNIMHMSESVFSRLIMSMEGRTMIIPLSGGYDSRYIVAMLNRLGYRKLVCYTYGKLNSYEVLNARRIAEALDLRWFFVEYEEKKWMDIGRTIVNEYCDRTFMFSSIPHLQEIIAFNELCNDPEFPKDGVIVPGFCGDLLGGSALLSDEEEQLIEYSEKWVTEHIINTQYNFDRLNRNYTELIERDIIECIESFQIDINSREGVQDFMESWFTVHRPAKYVVQSCRLYELFGYEWRLPLWDQEMLNLWYSVPLEFRKGKLLYDQWLFDELFNPMQIDFPKLSTQKDYERPLVKIPKDLIRKIIGMTWLTLGINLHEKGDPNGFKYLSRYLFKNLDNRYKYNYANQNINYLSGLWTLERYLGADKTLSLYREVTGKNKS